MGLFGVLFDVELIGSDGAIVWMVDQFEFHGFFAPWAEKRVAAKAFEKELLKGFSGNDAEAFGANGCFCGKYSGKLPTGFLVADMAVQAVVSDALEAFGEDVLNHAPDKAKGGQGFIFDLPRFMVFVPVAHRFPVIVLNAPHRDGRRDDIFCQISGEPPAAGRNLFFFDEGDEPFRVLFPRLVNVLFDAGVGDVLFEHVQKMVLPFAVDQVEGDIRDTLPAVFRGNAPLGEQDVQMGVVDSRSSGGLQDDDGTDVELDPFCAGFQDIEQASMSGPHERGKQGVRVAVEPEAERVGNRQNDVAVDDAGKQATADEVHPLV